MLPNLQTLALGGIKGFTGEGFPELVQLRTLNLYDSGVTNRGLVEIAEQTPKLVHLDLAWCEGLTDGTVMSGNSLGCFFSARRAIENSASTSRGCVSRQSARIDESYPTVPKKNKMAG